MGKDNFVRSITVYVSDYRFKSAALDFNFFTHALQIDMTC